MTTTFTTPLNEVFSRARFIDLSPVIESNMHGWQEHPDPSIIHDARNHEQHGYYLQMLVVPEHVGSHVDAPAHVLPNRMDRTIDTFPVQTLLRPGKLVDAGAEGLRPGELLTRESFERLAADQGVGIEADDIVLVRFGWDGYLTDPEVNTPSAYSWWGGNEPGFAEDLCSFLADVGVAAVGTDTAACDAAVVDGKILSAYGHDTYFLPRDILIIEGLHGLEALPNEFFFMAIPLRINRGSASPIRAIAVCEPETP